MSILNEIIGSKKPVNCSPSQSQEITTENGIESNNTETTLRIEFPTSEDMSFIGDRIPMAGGAVVSIGLGGLKLNSEDKKINSIITSNVKSITDLQLDASLTSLSKLHTAVNKELFDISSKNFRVMDGKIKAPTMYLSYYYYSEEATEESIIQSGPVPSMFKLCEFKYIPFEFFKEVCNNLDDNFKDVVGIAGRKFSYFVNEISKETVNDQFVSDLVLEFFPIVNISSDDIARTKVGQDPVIGGYYTIKNNRFFIKLPDISGRDSGQNSFFSLLEGDRLFIEVYHKAVATRVEIINYKMPPVANFTSNQDIIFPNPNENVEVRFSVKDYLDDDLTFYISPNRKSNVSQPKYITLYDNRVEVFSHPILTKPIAGKSRESIINTENPDFLDYIKSLTYESLTYLNDKTKSKFDTSAGYSSIIINKDLGIPFLEPESDIPKYLDYTADQFFGIKNRPEILINQYNGNNDQKNNDKYHSLASYGKIDILSSKMPKIYNEVSIGLISAKPVRDSEDPNGTTYMVTFKYEDLKGLLDFVQTKKGISSFSCYVGDSAGQLSRVSGPPLRLLYPFPNISSVTPTGYNDSGPILIEGPEIEIRITAEGFDENCEIKLVGRNNKPTVSIKLNDEDKVTFAGEVIILKLPANYFKDAGFVGSQHIKMYLTCNGDIIKTNYQQLYLVTSEEESRPEKPSIPIQFNQDEFSMVKPNYGIPLFKDGNFADIKITAQNSILIENDVVYAYLCLSESTSNAAFILENFALPKRIYKISSSEGDYLVPVDMVYELGYSNADSFYRKDSKSAVLQFPGYEYANYNLMPLEFIDSAYILITNIKIGDLPGNYETIESNAKLLGYEKLNFSDIDLFCFSFLKLGDLNVVSNTEGTSWYNEKAFIPPYTIIDIIIKDDSNVIQSTCAKTKYPQIGTVSIEEFIPGNFYVQPINVYNKIKDLYLIVADSWSGDVANGYDIYLNGTQIPKKKLVTAKPIIDQSKILFHFKDILPSGDGILDFSLVRRNSNFINKYTSDILYTQATAIIDIPCIVRPDVRDLIIPQDLPGEIVVNPESFIYSENTHSTAGLIVSSVDSKLLDSLYRDNNTGIIVEKTEDIYKLFQPINLNPSISLSLNINGEITNSYPQITESGVTSLGRNDLTLLANSAVSPDSFVYEQDLENDKIINNQQLDAQIQEVQKVIDENTVELENLQIQLDELTEVTNIEDAKQKKEKTKEVQKKYGFNETIESKIKSLNKSISDTQDLINLKNEEIDKLISQKVDPEDLITTKLALVFFNTYNKGFWSIKYNVPEVISISGPNGNTNIGLEVTNFTPGTYTFIVSRAASRNFSIIIDGQEYVPDSRPTMNPDGNYSATITIPDTTDGYTSNSGQTNITICVSTENSLINRATQEFGEEYEQTLETLNVYADKLPDSQAIMDKLKEIALRFVNFELPLPDPAKAVAKTICDYSFEAFKELKFALNDFRLLMIPVQVIFAIIDVICSLLNPVKLAKAIIRLFQSILDLLGLLPVIAVPVMFLQAMLHGLELIKCVFEKILLSVITIDNLVMDIKFAAKKPFQLRELKQVEESIEEFLNNIELDLKFLDPLISILAVFIDLLQIAFKFPCTITVEEGSLDCGIDGTILGGIVGGVASIDSEIVSEVMIPVAQFYTTDPDGDASSPEEYVLGDVVANNSSQTYLDSMNINSESLRAESTYDFNPTLAPTFTKTKKSGNKYGKVDFVFNYRAKNKTIDPNQTLDSELAFFNKDNNNLIIAEFGNLYSPIDGEEFLLVDVDKKEASVKPLALRFEVPIRQINEETGELVETGIEIINRTFDNIPMMALIDDELNVYFIEEDGIKYKANGFVDKIKAKIVNDKSAPKHRFSKEDVELEDGTIVPDVFDFPQLYFFDMRTIADQLEQFCVTSSINSLPLEEDNAADISNIIDTAQICFKDWQSSIQDYVSRIRNRSTTNLASLPNLQSSGILESNSKLEECVQQAADDMCRYVVNGLNTSFKILEDTNFEPRKGFVTGDLDSNILQGFGNNPADFTGAREYASGIGDNGIVEVGNTATIEIIPRDSYDVPMRGDLTDRILVEIVSDSTGGAKFILNEFGSVITKVNNTYVAKLTSTGVGEVALRAKVCTRTIQALTYQGTTIGIPAGESEEGCAPPSPNQGAQNLSNINILTKVDRILNVYFIQGKNNQLSVTSIESEIITDPQEFGTAMEN